MSTSKTYKDHLTEAMGMLAKHNQTVFVGQSVLFGGQAMHPTFASVQPHKLIEFPVAEDFQMGYCTGLAMEGFLPISVYPRFDFLLLAANQLVNHLDKIKELTGLNLKVIIRTAIGSSHPLDPGPQHRQDHINAFRMMLKNIPVYDLNESKLIIPSYQSAMQGEGSALLVEYARMYNDN